MAGLKTKKTIKKVRITVELQISTDNPMSDDMLLWAASNIYFRAGDIQEKKILDYGIISIRRLNRTGAVIQDE
jgi:hypothetical protein